MSGSEKPPDSKDVFDMIRFDEATLEALAVHRVGNRSAGDGVTVSHRLLEVSEVVRPLLLTYFLSPFRSEELFNLSHPSDIRLNEVYDAASAIFSDRGCLLEKSQKLAHVLYNHTTHAKIPAGEFYVARVAGCRIDEEPLEAVGFFKSESRETYLKVYPSGGNFEIGHDDGINIHKLDKGCLVFNTAAGEGYLAALVDLVNRGDEARYWRDDFLGLKLRSDSFTHTRAVMDLCRKFVTEKLPDEFEVSRLDQAGMLNRSIKFLKENESFEMEDFSEQVLGSPEVMSSFSSFKQEYAGEHDLEIPDQFEISGDAVKRQSRFMKSVIKLDKNFHIYVHGDGGRVEKGTDEARQLHFYKLFFREEH